jgi:hypothetical protein
MTHEIHSLPLEARIEALNFLPQIVRSYDTKLRGLVKDNTGLDGIQNPSLFLVPSELGYEASIDLVKLHKTERSIRIIKATKAIIGIEESRTYRLKDELVGDLELSALGVLRSSHGLLNARARESRRYEIRRYEITDRIKRRKNFSGYF